MKLGPISFGVVSCLLDVVMFLILYKEHYMSRSENTWTNYGA